MADDAGAQALFEKQAFMTACRLAHDKVYVFIAFQEGADRSALIGDGAGSGTVRDGDGVLGDVEAEALLVFLALRSFE